MKKTFLTLTGNCQLLTSARHIRWMWLLMALPVLLPSFLQANICPSRSLFSIGAGTFDTLRHKERMFQIQAEYTWPFSWYGIQPFGSLMMTQHKSVYLCFGICYDIHFWKHFVLTPSFAPGVYFKNGGKNLGFPLEFRSSIALAAQWSGGSRRLGIQFYHISNASLGHRNPGEESLVVFYSIAPW